MKKSLAACSWCSCSILSSTSASWDRARESAVLSSEFPSMAILLANIAVFPHSSGVEADNRTFIQSTCFTFKEQEAAGLDSSLSTNNKKNYLANATHPSCDWRGSRPEREASSAAAPHSPPPGICPQTTLNSKKKTILIYSSSPRVCVFAIIKLKRQNMTIHNYQIYNLPWILYQFFNQNKCPNNCSLSFPKPTSHNALLLPANGNTI